jgi:hypothetical protein
MLSPPTPRYHSIVQPSLPQRVAVTGLAAASLIALMLALPLGGAGYVTEAFAGGGLIFLVTWRRPVDWIAAGVVAAILAGIYIASRAAVVPWTGWEVAFPGSLFGMGALLVLLFRGTGAPDSERGQIMDTIRNTGFLPVLCLVSIVAVWLDLRLTPRTWDWSLYAFDQSFGVQPSFAVGRIYWSQPALRMIAGLIYSSLPVNMALMCAVWLRARSKGTDVRLAFVVMGVLGFLLYQLCPAAGPLYLTGRAFPYHTLPFSDALKSVLISGSPRNAMPSLHVASCLLIVYGSWRRGIALRAYALICLVATIFATLGTGEHYLIDLIVAVPLSVAVQLGCAAYGEGALRERIAAPAGLLALVVAWLIALRIGIASQLGRPALMLGAVATTLAVSMLAGLGIDLRMPVRWQLKTDN